MPLSRKHFRRSRDAPICAPARQMKSAGGSKGFAALFKERPPLFRQEAMKVNTYWMFADAGGCGLTAGGAASSGGGASPVSTKVHSVRSYGNRQPSAANHLTSSGADTVPIRPLRLSR